MPLSILPTGKLPQRDHVHAHSPIIRLLSAADRVVDLADLKTARTFSRCCATIPREGAVRIRQA
jgi:hypothetical protein